MFLELDFHDIANQHAFTAPIVSGRNADGFCKWCLREATAITDDVTAWADARDAARQRQ